MCLLVVKPRDVIINDIEKLCKDADSRNPDGFGFAYLSDSGKIVYEKGLYTVARQTHIIESVGKAPAIFHWRFGTGGGVNIENCHPFVVADGSVLFHNGVFSSITPTHNKSDTHILSQSHATIGEICESVRQYIGSGNKLAWFEQGNPHPMVLGIEAGTWENNVWYSNMYWKGASSNPRKSRITYSAYDDDDFESYRCWSRRTSQTSTTVSAEGGKTENKSALWPPTVAHQKDGDSPASGKNSKKKGKHRGVVHYEVDYDMVNDDDLQRLENAIYILTRRYGYAAMLSAIEDADMLLMWEETVDGEKVDSVNALVEAEADAADVIDGEFCEPDTKISPVEAAPIADAAPVATESVTPASEEGKINSPVDDNPSQDFTPKDESVVTA
jgi:predicted glutamine amidotransferase